MRLSTAAQMRECDRVTIEELGLPGIALMESAGRAAARLLMDTLPPGSRVGLLCGGGNNGGDGYVMARELLHAGHDAEVYLLAPRARISGDADINLSVLEAIVGAGLAPGRGAIHPWGARLAAGDPIEALLAEAADCDAWVDALLGTGLSKPVRAPYAQLIAFLNATPRPVFAVDLPSGLDADTGQPLGAAVEADVTATFGLAKIGLLVHPGRALCGRLEVVDISIAPGVFDRVGINAHAVTPTIARALVPPRPTTGHKGTFGHVLAVGGAPGKVGALLLCARAALRAGAGLVTAAGAPGAVEQVTVAAPEVMTEQAAPDALRQAAPGRILAVGPGLGTSPQARAQLMALLTVADRPMVLDADALNLIAADPEVASAAARTRAARIMTPHPGEFARLAGCTVAEVLADTVGHSLRLAASAGAVVVCKTASTVIAAPDGRLAVNTTGNPGMGTGGSGDVLTGIIAGLLAQGMDAWDAARLGVYLHGLAGDLAADARGPRSLTAGDLIEHLGGAWRRCEG